jgi:SPP1 gp7 family putative phage head morphogenesis protein
MTDVVLKNSVNDLVKRIADLLKIKISSEVVRRNLMEQFIRGWDEIERQADLNVQPNMQKIDFLVNYTFDNIKGMTDEMAEKLRKELSQSILNGETAKQMQDRVQEVMDVSIARAKMIARTELMRAYNTGREEAGRKAGFTKKYLFVTEDERTSEICGCMDSKYGSADKAIGINEKFSVTVNGKVIEALVPGFHVHCRTRLMVTD